MDITAKNKAIKEVEKKQYILLKKIKSISKLPKSKRNSTNTKRVFKMIHYATIIRSLQLQKLIIVAQPIPKKGLMIADERI